MGRIIFKQCRLNDALLLSTLLSTSLENLRRKGFPVDRILNLTQTLKLAKPIDDPPSYDSRPSSTTKKETDDFNLQMAYLASMFPGMDPELIRKELQAAQGNPDPMSLAANKLVENATNSSTGQMVKKPPTVPTPNTVAPPPNQESTSIFSMFDQIKKNLGLSGSDMAIEPERRQTQITRGDQPLPNTQQRSITPSSTNQIKSQLANSVSKLSSIQESRIHAQIPNDPEPSIPTPQSTKDPCKIIADADLMHVETIGGLFFYVDRAFGPSQSQEIASSNRAGLERFVMVLKVLADVFSISTNTMAMYWDQTGDTIAFNRNKSLFFNAKYYMGLHYVKCRQSARNSMPGSFGNQLSPGDEDPRTFYYWFMTFCHELAHNFVQ